MNKFFTFVLLSVLGGTLASCESSTTPPAKAIDTTIVTKGDRALFVVSEGAYDHSNGTLDVFLFHHTISIHDSGSVSDTTVSDSMYHEHPGVLTGMGLGNDILITGNRALVVDNGSNELDVVDADSLKSIASIPISLDAPNKIALIAPNKLLVTRRNTTSAAIVDLSVNSITDSIPLGGASIAVAVLNNKAYITTGASAYSGPYALKIVDLVTHNVIKTLSLPESGEQALPDSTSGTIIIGMSGDGTTTSSKIYFVNAMTDAIVDSLTPGTPMDDPELTTGSKHYIVMGTKVYTLTVPSHQLSAPIVQSSTYYYKGTYDAATNALYLGNAGNFSNSGTIDAYDATTGKLLWSQPAGIAPGHFAFYH